MHLRRLSRPLPLVLLGALAAAALLSTALLRKASAALEAPAEIVIESCSRSYTAGMETHTYAEHAFPGLSRRQLASVRAIGHLASGRGAPPGYEFVVADSSMFVRDGALAVSCGNKVAASFDSVAFLIPR
jgi:hypothetical protein